MRGTNKARTLSAFVTATLLAVMLVMFAGCGRVSQPVIKEALVVIKIVDSPAPDWPAGTAAITRGLGTGLSTIEILRDYYPECVTHEVRHVMEGSWHPGQPTTCIIERR